MHEKQLAIRTYLITAYNAPWRTYHNEQHINYLLAKATEWKHNAKNPDFTSDAWVNWKNNANDSEFTSDVWAAIIESIWWHDIVYNIWFPPKLNETESALQALDTLRNIYYDNVTTRIYKAILATANHLEDQQLGEDDLVTKVMLDVDMAGFGEDYSIVKMNSDNILEESFMVVGNLEKLLNHRINFLSKLLLRKRIFYTDYFHDKYEEKARTNISRQINDTQEELNELLMDDVNIKKPSLNLIELLRSPEILEAIRQENVRKNTIEP